MSATGRKKGKGKKVGKKGKKVLTIDGEFGILSKHLKRGGQKGSRFKEKILKRLKKVLDNDLRV